ncbi:MAG: Gfo/Idh/MocA family oxidoreductase [Gemmatales bacterium]|nr:Gfo/Idh/MocA family oxidoreductase [Gemmatales bacterium]MCS7161437.1 Gfo/Idh/MocA family oxidoreductase [Gemmatales bacterium]MDW8176640.1 Gfo/Idh/MocA family oxidoreductase [Gemmatales bacterium]MDW8223271.1 Gfo/Idh/MocA family oxidoreductase [Gemmatales bacterium]
MQQQTELHPIARMLSLHYQPRLPQRRDWGIGCIGAGFIMRDCHLVAYRQAGFRPVAIYSRTYDRANALAQRFSIPRCYQRLEELFADPEVEILDIAVPPDQQPAIIQEAVRWGGKIRGILAQKPLAMSYRAGRELVELCEQAGITLAVNQNMRYDQSVRALKDLLNRGWLGEPVLATIEMRAIPHWMPWAQGLRSLSTFIMSIHHLDTFRFWLGNPERVLASTRPDPRTRFAHSDGINLYILEYAHGCRACAWDDVWTGPCKEGSEGDIYIRWRVEGTEGLARGTIGWPAYPARCPSTLDFTTRQWPGYWFSPRWPDVWFPDAFIGTMAQLLCAIECGSTPEISGRDNLDTLALCEAVLLSAQQHRAVTLDEIRDHPP